MGDNELPPNVAAALWDPERARELFGESVDARTAPPSFEVALEFPTIAVGDEPEEDVGPSAGQHPGASDETHETASGFVDLMPSAGVQSSIERAMRAARRGGDTDAAASNPATNASCG